MAFFKPLLCSARKVYFLFEFCGKSNCLNFRNMRPNLYYFWCPRVFVFPFQMTSWHFGISMKCWCPRAFVFPFQMTSWREFFIFCFFFIFAHMPQNVCFYLRNDSGISRFLHFLHFWSFWVLQSICFSIPNDSVTLVGFFGDSVLRTLYILV